MQSSLAFQHPLPPVELQQIKSSARVRWRTAIEPAALSNFARTASVVGFGHSYSCPCLLGDSKRHSWLVLERSSIAAAEH